MNDANAQTGAETRDIVIRNEYGIHARPAALFVKLASRFESDLWVEKDGNAVSGKSIMGLMTLQASCGSKLTLRAEGPDAGRMLDALADLVDRKFEE